MTIYEYGDVVLVPFPFTDQSTSKKRPAVVISGELFHQSGEDLIILAITSRSSPRQSTEAPVLDWKEAGLLKPSLFKATIATVESKLILRKLGHLSQRDEEALFQLLRSILSR